MVARQSKDEFLRLQAQYLDRQFSNLVAGEEEERARFLALAADTYDELLGTPETWHMLHVLSINPDSAASPVCDPKMTAAMSQSLRERWRDWRTCYQDIRARHPRLALRDMMQDISETDVFSPWPDEAMVQDWVDRGRRDPVPFDDCRRILTPEFYERLRALRVQVEGWLYYDVHEERVVYVPEQEWQRIRASRQAARDRARKRQEGVEARFQRDAEALDRIAREAREDDQFWTAIKNLELEREAASANTVRRPRRATDTKCLPGWTMAGWMTPEEQERSRQERESRSVAPIYEEFIRRARRPADELTKDQIVIRLRSLVRRELGLNESFYLWTEPDGS